MMMRDFYEPECGACIKLPLRRTLVLSEHY